MSQKINCRENYLGNSSKQLTPTLFAELISDENDYYEYTGLETDITNLYFDIDYNYPDETSYDADFENIEAKEDGLKTILLEALNKIAPDDYEIVAARCHRKVLKNEYQPKDKFKFSYRLYVPSHTAPKNVIKEFAIKLNGDAEQGIYDTSVYDDNRKIRCPNAKKPYVVKNKVVGFEPGSELIVCDTTIPIQKYTLQYFRNEDTKQFQFFPDITPKAAKKTKKTTIELDVDQEPVQALLDIETIGELDLFNDEIQYYCEKGAFKNKVQQGDEKKWISLGGMFLSIMSDDKALKYWKLATSNVGTINKQNEADNKWQYIKRLQEDPIFAMNSIRKEIKQEFPSLITGWKALKKEESKMEKELIQESLKKIKEEQRLKKEEERKLMDQQKEIKAQEKAEKLLIREQEKEQKIEKKEKKEKDVALIEKRRSTHTFVSSDDEAIDILLEEVKDDFIYSCGVMFYKNNNKWEKDPININDLLKVHILESQIYRENEDAELIPYCQNIGSAKNVLDGLYSKLRIKTNDKNLYKKFHSTGKNKLCFNDGVLDFQARTFTEWKDIPEQTIYTTIIIDRDFGDYFKNPNTEFIENNIKKNIMSNLFGSKTNLVIEFYARAITANIKDKNFLSYSGNRDSGKGILYALFKSSMEDYVCSFNLANMVCVRESKKSSDEAKENAWLMDFEFARCAFAQETDENENGDINKNCKISNKMLKAIVSGGDELQGRRMRQDIQKFTIDTTLSFFGNNELAINGSDSDQHHLKCAGVKQYITKGDYEDKLKEFGKSYMTAYAIRSETLKDDVEDNVEYKNGLIWLLFSNFKDEAPNIKIRSNNDDDDDRELSIRELIFTKYKITKDDKDRVSKEDLFTLLGKDKKKITYELEELGCVGNKCLKIGVSVVDETGKESKKQVPAFKCLVLKTQEVAYNEKPDEIETDNED